MPNPYLAFIPKRRPPAVFRECGHLAVRLLALAVLFLNFAGCKPEQGSKNTHSDQPATNRPSISASPNPVPFAEGPGKTVISWDTGDGSDAEVYVSSDGGEEKLFAKGSVSSSAANWIDANTTFEFRLYEGTDRKNLLGAVKVTRLKK